MEKNNDELAKPEYAALCEKCGYQKRGQVTCTAHMIFSQAAAAYQQKYLDEEILPKVFKARDELEASKNALITDLLKDELDEARLVKHKELEQKYEKMAADTLVRIQTLHSTAKQHASQASSAQNDAQGEPSEPDDSQEQKLPQD